MNKFRKYFWIIGFCLQIFLINYLIGDSSKYTVIPNQIYVPILTPSLAQKETLKIRLDNGLEVYLISDPKATEAGAVLTVQAGSWDDPADYPGLAHFLEHMLFLGTEKYPVESEYDRFIRANDGQTNAYTTTDHTLYLFSISSSAFQEALDRFSFFFKKPLFNPSGINRELHAVDQEFAKNFYQDGFRENQVRKELANDQHPFHRFSSGNLKSLSKVSQDDLKEWYEKHYSAHLMRLIVYAPYSIETLKDWVIRDFKDIPSIEREPFHSSHPMLAKEMEGKMVYIEAVNNTRNLQLTWELPASLANINSFKPADVISSILQYEGEGGLLSLLKAKGLAQGIYAADQRLAKENFLFSLHIALTQKGMENIPEVIGYVFQAIQTLEQQQLPSYIFDELKHIQTLRYQYQSREDLFDYLMNLGGLFVYENLETFPESAFVPQTFNEEAIHEFLHLLKPQQTYFTLLTRHSSIPFKQLESWIGVPYQVTAIPSEQLEAWSHLPLNPQFHLPSPNLLIPQTIALVDPPSGDSVEQTTIPQPILLTDNPQAKIYFAQDNRFYVPQTQWFFEIKTPSINVNRPETVIFGDLYIQYLEKVLQPYLHMAEHADLTSHISRTSNGIRLSFLGYPDHVEKLFHLVLERLKNSHPSENDFRQLKNSLLSYSDEGQGGSQQINPLQQGLGIYKDLLSASYPLPKMETLERLSYQNFLNYIDHLYDYYFIEGFFYGNISYDQALTLSQELQSSFKGKAYAPQDWVVDQTLVLPSQGPYVVEMQMPSSSHAIVLGIEEKEFSFKARAAQQILAQSMNSAFYSTLRTQQQTGYLVYSRAEEVNRHLFTFFAVQSSTHDPRDLLARFELFIETFLENMEESELTEQQFEVIRQSLLNHLEHAPQNLTEMGELLNNLAFEHDGDFEWVDKRIQGFKELTYPEFIEISKNFLGKQNKRRLAILIRGKSDKDFHYQSLSSPNELRKISQYS